MAKWQPMDHKQQPQNYSGGSQSKTFLKRKMAFLLLEGFRSSSLCLKLERGGARFTNPQTKPNSVPLDTFYSYSIMHLLAILKPSQDWCSLWNVQGVGRRYLALRPAHLSVGANSRYLVQGLVQFNEETQRWYINWNRFCSDIWSV